jgi:hypothetical protein
MEEKSPLLISASASADSTGGGAVGCAVSPERIDLLAPAGCAPSRSCGARLVRGA